MIDEGERPELITNEASNILTEYHIRSKIQRPPNILASPALASSSLLLHLQDVLPDYFLSLSSCCHGLDFAWLARSVHESVERLGLGLREKGIEREF